VFVPERYGHGRTADIDGPLTYEAQAQHTIAFIEALDIGPANLVGWSDGALAGLLTALRRPKLVRKLVFVDNFVTLDDAPAFYLPMMEGMTADTAPPFLVEPYRALSPDGPDHFPVVFEKLHTMWVSETGIEVSDLARVASPTLVLAGDGGGMPLAHVAAVQAAVPDCQVAVVPGTSHALTLEKPHIVNQLILDFLADEQVEKIF
jgi:pimeloyl-ACP methyl ester carboxylesterase